ncbi:MAG: cytochrome c, partial [Bacteroidota bacterium]|nr:cytochrome c [Bacteroidota bacterium]
MSIRSSILLFCLSGVILLAGCRGTISEQPPIHPNPNMDTQEKLVPQRASAFFVDGSSMRTPPEGTVARGELREDAAYFTGKNDDGSYVAMPFVVNAADRARGAERYMIYCQPCHGAAGDGKGVIADPKYRYPIPPTSYLTQPILDAADGYLYEVIANGVRSMPSYRQQIPVRDRWLIVAHVRALQQRGNETAPGTGASAPNASAPNA